MNLHPVLPTHDSFKVLPVGSSSLSITGVVVKIVGYWADERGMFKYLVRPPKPLRLATKGEDDVQVEVFAADPSWLIK